MKIVEIYKQIQAFLLKNKKITLTFLTSIFIFSVIFVPMLQNQCHAKGQFKTLNFAPEGGSSVVKLNDNEIFYPGGWITPDIGKTYIPITAKIYKIKEDEIVDLKSIMKFPRNYYNIVKLDQDNILISFGNSYKASSIYVYTENYNLKTNKFTVLKDSKLINIPLQDGIDIGDEIFYYDYMDLKGSYFKLFDKKNKKNIKIGKNISDLVSKQERLKLNKYEDYNSNYFHLNPRCLLLNDGRILIYDVDYRREDYHDYCDDALKYNIVEFYHTDKKSFISLELPKNIKLYYTNVKLEDGRVLFIGSSDKKLLK